MKRSRKTDKEAEVRSREDASTLGWEDRGFKGGGKANKRGVSGIRASQQLPLAQGHPSFQHVGLAGRRAPIVKSPLVLSPSRTDC